MKKSEISYPPSPDNPHLTESKRYSRDFKEHAVQAASLPHVSLTDVAKNLGISDTQLKRWIIRSQAEKVLAASDPKAKNRCAG